MHEACEYKAYPNKRPLKQHHAAKLSIDDRIKTMLLNNDCAKHTLFLQAS